MAGLLYRLGRFSSRRHWQVIVAWIVILALAGVAYSVFKGTISSSISIPGTPTQKVTDELASKFPAASGGSGSLLFETKDGKAFTATEKTAVANTLKEITNYSGVKSATNPFTTQSQLEAERTKVTQGQAQITAGKKQIAAAQAKLDAEKAQATAAGQLAAVQAQLTAGQAQIDSQTKTLDASQAKLTTSSKLLGLATNVRFVSKDGSAALATLSFTQATINVSPDLKTKIVDKAADAGISGVNVYVDNNISQGVPSILGPGEVIGVVVAAVVLFIMLGTIIGAALPLISAILGIGVSALAALAFSGVVTFLSVTPVLGVMLGLAVGIDYSLFILNRHRNQLKQGMELHESIGLANGTSGNAVVFAGSTVIVALVALNITGIPFLGLMGSVGAAAVAVAILVAISFTPALLSVVGMRILKKKEREAIGSTASVRVPNKPMSSVRAVVTLVLGVVVLGVIAMPAMQMRLGLPDGASEAVNSSQYKEFKAVENKFGAGQNGPLLVVADLPSKVTGDALLDQEVAIGTKLKAQKNVSAVAPIGASKDGTVIAFQVLPTGGPSSASTETLVHSLRNLSPLTTSVGKVDLGVAGNASANIDVSDKLAAVLPLYLAVVVGLSIIILIIVFRSFLVPLTATAGFVLSLLASFGGLTAIFQYGWLGFLFGVHDPGPILSFLPIIEVGVLFGLAMDYQLFLVSGMREAYAHGASAKIAVQRGLHAGRTVVAAAAIIMISVFAGFIFSDSSTITPIGFGLAFGVLVDAFIVRQLLIPAAMHLLGRSAWWFPKWLDRILPDADVEGAKLERSHPHDGVAAPAAEAAAQAAEPEAVSTHTGAHALPVEPDAPVDDAHATHGTHADEHGAHGSEHTTHHRDHPSHRG